MKTIKVFYDNWCPNCTKFISLINKTDWFHLVEPIPLRNPNIRTYKETIDLELAENKMASMVNENTYYGYDSIYLIFMRIPMMWLFLPLLFLLKVTKLGDLAYNELALKRTIIPIHCSAGSCNLEDR